MSTCEFCKKKLTETDLKRAYQKASGWTRRREGGGTNALRLQVTSKTEWACEPCVDSAVRTGYTGQGAMF